MRVNGQRKTIALDIGGVCVKLRHPEMFRFFGWQDNAPSGFMEMADLMEVGEMSDDEWLAAFNRFTDRRFSREEIIRGWNIVIGEPMDGMTEFLMSLKKAGFRLIFFSDTSRIHVTEIFRTPDISSLTDGAVYSFEAGAKKPSPAMFRLFEERYGTPVLYLDDKPENIEGGIRHGWRSHRFTGFANLEKMLADNPL